MDLNGKNQSTCRFLCEKLLAVKKKKDEYMKILTYIPFNLGQNPFKNKINSLIYMKEK